VGITDFQGVDTTKLKGSTNPVLKRHIEDYQFILGFKEKSWFHQHLFYPLWKVTSDCGRSLLIWLMWSIFFVAVFTWIYCLNLKTWFKPTNLDWFNALYFSVVTFTTLGFGDVTPNLASRTAQSLVIAQVIIGYIMLGGLISILANKLARRA
jgi:Trk-type K+ transport system membrane component